MTKWISGTARITGEGDPNGVNRLPTDAEFFKEAVKVAGNIHWLYKGVRFMRAFQRGSGLSGKRLLQIWIRRRIESDTKWIVTLNRIDRK